MTINELTNNFDAGLQELYAGRAKSALRLFEKAAAEDNTPLVRSYIAYCRARTGCSCLESVAICMDAHREEPKNTDIYLNLGKIYLLAGKRKQAIQIFRLGLRQGRNMRLSAELNSLGVRKSPPFPFLQRNNPLNKYAGLLLTRLSLR